MSNEVKKKNWEAAVLVLQSGRIYDVHVEMTSGAYTSSFLYRILLMGQHKLFHLPLLQF
jgi:hypothetical protein